MRKEILSSILTGFLAISASAQAPEVVLAPVSGTTDLGEFPSLELIHSYDQSGLSSPYTPWVTEFDTYVASGPVHDTALGPPGTFYGSPGGATTGTITYDLGDSYQLTGFALWNTSQGQEATGVQDFSLVGSETSDFSSSIDLGSYTATIGPGGGPASVQVFAFPLAVVRYVKLQIESNWGNDSYVAVAEANFRGIPEPSSSLLLLVALPALAWRMRRS